MKIKVSCNNCRTELEAPAELAGKRAACPKCRQAITVPTATPSAQQPIRPPAQPTSQRLSEPENPWANIHLNTGADGVPESLPMPAAKPKVGFRESFRQFSEEMAKKRLQPCRDCGGIVSENAAACPHCGSKAFNTAKRVQKFNNGLMHYGCLLALLGISLPFLAMALGMLKFASAIK